MVTHLNIALDDSDAEQVREVKEELGLTWAEFLVEAADALDEEGPENVVPEIGEPTAVETETESDSQSDENTEALEPDLSDLDLPGSGDKLERRQAAIERLYDYLRENGTARKRDFLELVDPDEVGYSSPASFWSNCIKSRETLSALPGVVSPGEGEHTWKFDRERR